MKGWELEIKFVYLGMIMKEEKTLYDIVTRLEGIISDLNDWSESEALNVESLQRQLYKVKKKIRETLD